MVIAVLIKDLRFLKFNQQSVRSGLVLVVFRIFKVFPVVTSKYQ
jgi:hypothetical protein